MHIRTEQRSDNRPTIITVTTSEGITCYFVEATNDYDCEGWVQVHTLEKVIDIVTDIRRNCVNWSNQYYGHWFYDYESVCRWINERVMPDEKVTQENY